MEKFQEQREPMGGLGGRVYFGGQWLVLVEEGPLTVIKAQRNDPLFSFQAPDSLDS